MRMRWRLPGALMAVVLLLAGCSSGDGEERGSGDGPITLWTVYDTADRIAIMKDVLADFTKASGVKVELVGVSAPDLPQAMVSAAAAGDLPDVVVHGVELTSGWVSEGILDPAAATEMVEELGADTYQPAALDLIRVDSEDGEYGTVPSDGWGQMVFYRTDLFEAAGLEPPTTYENILAAAKALNGKGGVHGFALGNSGGDPFTHQVFEDAALINGCQLVNDSGEVTIDSPECAETIQFLVDLNEYAPTGGDVDTTRANYLAGKAAMVSWSPHLLDELAGFFPDTPLTCPQCKSDQQWLVDRTAMVPLRQGPSGDRPTQYGITINLGITTSADVEPAKELVRYLQGDGYSDFLSISPEGRFPMRQGPQPGDTSFVDAWSTLRLGSGDATTTVGELYGQEVVDTIAKSATGFTTWAIPQGQGALKTALSGDLELTNILRTALDGSATPEEAAKRMAEHAEQVASELG